MSGNSFAAGTLVDTGRGSLPIEQVRIGDQVLAWDEAGGQRGYRKVIHLIRREQASLVAVTLATGEVIRATAEHPFHVEGIWVPAGELKAGQRLTTRDGKSVAVRAVRVEAQSSATTVYNLSVDTDETYHVGRAGVLVHNAKGSRCGGVSWDQRKFKRQLGTAGYPHTLGPQAHHVIPKKQIWENPAHASLVAKLKAKGFDPGDSNQNGVWLPSRDGRPQFNACVHRGPHSKNYINEVAKALSKEVNNPNSDLDSILAVIDGLRDQMANGKLPLGEKCHY